MKILSYEECKKELSNLATYGANDIIISSEDIDEVMKNKNLLVMSSSEYCGHSAGGGESP